MERGNLIRRPRRRAHRAATGSKNPAVCSLLVPLRLGWFFMKFRGRNAHSNRPAPPRPGPSASLSAFRRKLLKPARVFIASGSPQGHAEVIRSTVRPIAKRLPQAAPPAATLPLSDRPLSFLGFPGRAERPSGRFEKPPPAGRRTAYSTSSIRLFMKFRGPKAHSNTPGGIPHLHPHGVGANQP
jgi:hypothetical protein